MQFPTAIAQACCLHQSVYSLVNVAIFCGLNQTLAHPNAALFDSIRFSLFLTMNYWKRLQISFFKNRNDTKEDRVLTKIGQDDTFPFRPHNSLTQPFFHVSTSHFAHFSKKWSANYPLHGFCLHQSLNNLSTLLVQGPFFCCRQYQYSNQLRGKN